MVTRLPVQPAARRRFVAAVGIVPAEVRVVAKAVAAMVMQADPSQQVLPGIEGAAECDARRRAAHIDQPGQGVRAVACAL